MFGCPLVRQFDPPCPHRRALFNHTARPLGWVALVAILFAFGLATGVIAFSFWMNSVEDMARFGWRLR